MPAYHICQPTILLPLEAIRILGEGGMVVPERDEPKGYPARIAELESEVAELRADRERLEVVLAKYWITREEIDKATRTDAARKAGAKT